MKGYLIIGLITLSGYGIHAQPDSEAIKKAGILSYYIIPAGLSNKAPKLNNYLEVDYRMAVGSNDSLLNETFTTGEHVHLPVNHPSFKEIFLNIKEGDRVQMVVRTDSFYKYTIRRPIPGYVKAGDSLSFFMKIYEILDDEGLMKKQMAKDNEHIEYDSARFNNYIRGYRNVIKTERGLHYMVTRQGSGAQPKTGDSVTVHYRGYFLDGKVFDKDENGYSFIAGLGQVIAGMDEAISLMKVGTKMKLFIPYFLAYGSEGTSLIPPYSSLIFDIELVAVKHNF